MGVAGQTCSNSKSMLHFIVPFTETFTNRFTRKYRRVEQRRFLTSCHGDGELLRGAWGLAGGQRRRAGRETSADLRRSRIAWSRAIGNTTAGGGSHGGGSGSGRRGGGGGGDDASGESPSKRLGMLAGVVESYRRALERYPIRTKALTAAFLNFFADLTAQYFERRKHPSEAAEGWQLRRTLSFAIIGLCFVGPGLHGWFSFLERAFPPTRWSLFAKLAIDQTLGATAFNGILLVLLYWLEHGGQFIYAWQSMKHRLPPTMIGNWKVWPAAQLVNFAFVPPAFRVLYVNSIAFFWTIYLSEIAHRSITKEEK
ncbi:hypothetical protein CCYA_CCYA17G4397 [Cyanidiococcus yangmingshanensis]|nr:hypothetical protein CCYA_CCYA17G4397 [Cyanidiococcus yangmingshanensis]